MSYAPGYSKTQIWLHWAVVLLLIVQYLFNDAMGHTFHDLMESGSASAGVLTYGHIVLGIAVLALAIWRLILRASHGTPEPPENDPAIFRRGAAAVHWLLYALLFLIPIAGLVAYYGQLGWAAETHSILTTLLLWLAGLHVAAALYHQYVKRDHLIRRMMKPGA
ncbi:cytochrome b [Thioclava electrotropha]|uniref:Cytochrome b n=1 Tax=Thioclava electrotropha TaxID=1549850 RepID=A0ABX6YX61_9RHOB|nr:cytochrome b/b6 domain-containing protein [Thioclava electrotropha]QPZ92449.1 cytochrome b [Thioclava electrotropha]